MVSSIQQINAQTQHRRKKVYGFWIATFDKNKKEKWLLGVWLAVFKNNYNDQQTILSKMFRIFKKTLTVLNNINYAHMLTPDLVLLLNMHGIF